MSQRRERRSGVRAVGGLGLLIATLAFGASPAPPSLATSKVVDLSHPFEGLMQVSDHHLRVVLPELDK